VLHLHLRDPEQEMMMATWLRNYWFVMLCIVISLGMTLFNANLPYLVVFWTGWIARSIWRS